MMTMPLSVPLSGLTTIPLALCPMNGQGNMGMQSTDKNGIFFSELVNF